MCGICGSAGYVDRDKLGRMTDALTHRGPNDGGVYVDVEASIGLGNCRLSILDLSPKRHMPMTSALRGRLDPMRRRVSSAKPQYSCSRRVMTRACPT